MPRMREDIIVKNRVGSIRPPASEISPEAIFRPRPVRVTTPMMIPAVAQAAAVTVGQPQVGVFLLRGPLHAPDAEDDLRPVGRDLRVGGNLERIEVVGRRQAGRGGVGVGHEGAPFGMVWSLQYHNRDSLIRNWPP